MEQTDLISVILPVYNVADYLPRCLDSILNNTYRNLEIICVNDGSTDNCLEILRDYAARDSRFVVLTQENGGICAARNAGLAAAHGAYIGFIDPDDWIHPNYMEYLYRAITENKTDMSACGYMRVWEGRTIPETADYTVELLDTAGLFSPNRPIHAVWARLYRRELLDGILFDSSLKIEDAAYHMSVLIKHQKLSAAFIKAPMYAYCQREGSLARSVHENENLALAEWYVSRSSESNSKQVQGILMERAAKSAMSARMHYYLRREMPMVRRCNAVIRTALPCLRNDRLAMRVLYRFPDLYERYRLYREPYLKSYMAEQRKLRKKKYRENGSGE